MLQHQNDVTVVAFSPDGKRIATERRAAIQLVRLWSAETGAPVGPAMQHKAYVLRPCSARMESTYYRSVGAGGSLVNRNRRIAWAADANNRTGFSVSYLSPDARAVLLCEKSRCVLWSHGVWKTSSSKAGERRRRRRAVAFSPDGRRAVTGAESGSVQQWSVETGQRIEPAFRVAAVSVTCGLSSTARMAGRSRWEATTVPRFSRQTRGPLPREGASTQGWMRAGGHVQSPGWPDVRHRQLR